MNTTKKYSLVLLFAFLFTTFFYSCVKKEFDTVDYEGLDHTDVIPIGSAVLTVDKIINKQDAEENVNLVVRDNLYHLVYHAERIEYIRDYYNFPDEQGNGGKTLEEVAEEDPELQTLIGATGIGVVVSDETYTSNEFETNVFFDLSKEGIEDAQLTKMVVRNGELNFLVTKDFTDLQHELILDIRIPGLLKPDGQPLELSVSVPSGQRNANTQVPLVNHTMIFNQNGVENEITAFFKATINAKAGRIIRSVDEINIDFSLRNIEYNLLEGEVGTFYMGRQTEVSSINVFENSISNPRIKVKDPSFIITSRSTTGVPAEIILHNLEFQRKEEPTVPVELIDNTFETPFIQDVSNKDIPVESVRRLSNADTKSGNGVSNVVEAGPDKQFTETDILVNGVLDPTFFLTYNSYLDMDFEVDIPLEVAIENYEIRDTIDNYLRELNEIAEEASIREVFIDVYTINTFPFDSKLILYMLDVNGNPVDTLGSDVIVKAPVTINGETTSSFKKDVRFTLSQEKYNRLVGADVDRMVIVASLFTPVDPNVVHYRITPGNKLIISIQAGAEFLIK